MSDVRDRLGRLEKLMAATLTCQGCAGKVAIRVVRPGEKLKDEDRPGPCPRCGISPDLIVVTSVIPAMDRSKWVTASTRDESDPVGRLRIDDPDPGLTSGPPN
jgi:hypothetical protein